MNSREIVIKAIDFDYPERVPLCFPELGVSDIATAPAHIVNKRIRKHSIVRRNISIGISGEDEWGCF